MSSVRNRLLRLAAVAVLLPALASCGDDGGSSSAPTANSDAPLADQLPQQYRDAGVIKVGSDVAYAPVEFFDEDGTTVIGIDPDLAAALGEQLGVRFEFTNSTFDGLITALNSKRFDIIMSAMSDTKERQGELDFVDYFQVGTSILVKKGNPDGISSLDDLCGKTIALQQGTTQEEVAAELKTTCEDKGSTLEVLDFPTDPEALLQVKNGRAVADLNDFPVAAYNAQTAGGGNDFEVVGEQIEAGPYGIGVRKEDTALRDALKAALDAIIKNGEYAKVLEKWNVSQGAVDKAVINGGS